MAKPSLCNNCGEHKSRMVYRSGSGWVCGDCERDDRDRIRVIQGPAPTFVGLPSTARLRTGLTHLPPTSRSWTR